MTLASWFMLVWAVLMVTNFALWLRTPDSSAGAPARFFYYPASTPGRAIGYLLAALVGAASVSGIAAQESAVAARLAYFLWPYALYTALSLGTCYSIWRRFRSRPN